MMLSALLNVDNFLDQKLCIHLMQALYLELQKFSTHLCNLVLHTSACTRLHVTYALLLTYCPWRLWRYKVSFILILKLWLHRVLSLVELVYCRLICLMSFLPQFHLGSLYQLLLHNALIFSDDIMFEPSS